MNNCQEWLAATEPTNQLSVLRMLSLLGTPEGLNVTWQSVSNRTYYPRCRNRWGRNCSILLRKSSMTIAVRKDNMVLVTKTRPKALTLIESCSNCQPLAT